MQPTPKSIEVLIDKREKFPLLFPPNIVYTEADGSRRLIAVTTNAVTLDAGDYTLAGAEGNCRIERKGSVQEVCTNLLTTDRQRALSAFRRLASSCLHPILLLDLNPSDFLPGDPHLPGPPAALDALHRLATGLGLQLYWAGPCKTAIRRRQLGGLVAHLLLSTHLMASDTDRLPLSDEINELRRQANFLTYQWRAKTGLGVLAGEHLTPAEASSADPEGTLTAPVDLDTINATALPTSP